MVQYIQKYKKGVAIDMRKKGFSYSAIQKSVAVPKSTLSTWLKRIKLTPAQLEILQRRQISVAKLNARRRRDQNSQMIEKIRASSIKDIRDISRREIWLIGIVLCWQQRQRNLLETGDEKSPRSVMFSSSDANLIKVFLRWLKEVGNIRDTELKFDIFLKKNPESSALERQRVRNGAIRYWGEVVNFPESKFTHIYLQKGSPRRRIIRKTHTPISHGFLRIRVKASSMLARQITGWIAGIQLYITSPPK